MTDDNKKKTHSKTTIIVVIIIVVAILAIIGGLTGKDTTNESSNDVLFYLNETMPYDDIDITVTNIIQKPVQNEDSNSPKYLMTISFSLKNNRKKEFKFSYDNIYIKIENRGEKYEYSPESLGQALFSETLMAGGSNNYDIRFYTPYPINEQKYIMYFDWGILHAKQSYRLYNRDGSLPTFNATEDNSDEEYRQTVENLRDDLYNIYYQYVYDKISSGMYYSDVQTLIDSATRQCKQKISTLNVQLDLSSGTYFPKWIATVRTNNSKTYPLFYIQIDCGTSYQVTHKYIGKYDIN